MAQREKEVQVGGNRVADGRFSRTTTAHPSERRDMRRVSVGAVLTGGAADIIATNLAILPVAVGVFANLDVASLPAAEQTAVLTKELTSSPALYTTCLILGSACSVLGGWVAARVAGREELLHGALSAFLCMALGVYGWIDGPSGVSPWHHAAFFVLSPTLGTAGGFIRAQQLSRRAAEPRSSETSRAHALEGWQRVLYVTDRFLTVLAALFAVGFAIIAAFSRGKGDHAGLVGAIALTVLGVIVMLLYIWAANALVAQRRRHWAIHAGALGLTLLPFMLT